MIRCAYKNVLNNVYSWWTNRFNLRKYLEKIKNFKNTRINYTKQITERPRKLNIYYSSDVKITNFLVCTLSGRMPGIDNVNTDLREHTTVE